MMRPIIPYLAVLISIAGVLPATAQPVLFPTPLSPRIANYVIDVRLDVANRKITGHEILNWRNTTSSPASELQFHLYLNAFRNKKTTFMAESHGSMRGFAIDKEGWGSIDITSLKIGEGKDIRSSMEYICPDDGNQDDRTVFRIPLENAILPGNSVQVTFDYEAILPTPPFARSGAKKEFFFVGQWFPKIGVFEEGKWNCHQYHATSEFFSDFGVYDVRMTVPGKNILGATGVQVSVTQNGDGTATHYYHAEDVHDFAWTTSPEFVEFKGRAENVDIRVLMQADHAGQGMRHVAAAQTAIEYFHKWYGPYPYPNLTVVDPRRDATGAGGMEYPTLITAGTAYGVPEGIRLPELVIIHEFGHNYWYGMVASNEFEESWLDEGINTYSEIQIMQAAYGPAGDILDVCGFKMNDIDLQHAQYQIYPGVDPTIRKAWEYYSGASYGINSYSKPGLILTTLQRYLGDETMQRIMRTYFERWRFRHPTSKDFVQVANEVSGKDLNWFFDQALYSNAVLDYSVDRIRINPVPEENGTTTSADTGHSNTTGQLYLNEIDLRRLGTFVFPVELTARFDNDEVVHEKWDGKDPWKKFTYKRTSRLVAASIDPDHKVVLDVNMTNNSKTVAEQRSGVTRISTRFLFWLQTLFDQPELLNVFTMLPGIF